MFGFIRISLLIAVSAIVVISSIVLIAQPENGGRNRAQTFKIITYTNIEGKTVWARVITEDREYVTISYPENSRIVTNTIHRDMIIENSMVHQNISEFDYWKQMAEYFYAKTWDFQNDGQDFVQAKRCYQNARDVVINLRGKDHAMAKEIDSKISELDREAEKWIEMVKEKVEFDKLEFQSRLQIQMVQFDSTLTDNTLAIEKIQEDVEKLQEMPDAIENLKKEIVKSFEAVNGDMKSISQDVEKNSLRIDRIWRIYEDPYYNRTRRPIIK